MQHTVPLSLFESIYAVASAPSLQATTIPLLILFEPPIALMWWHQLPNLPEVTKALAESTKLRRDRWESKQEALKYFKQRTPWKFWDSRALNEFVVCHFSYPNEK